VIAATGGIVLALQITYKWQIPFIKSILRWHVEFGAALAATGLLHFMWHIPYFKSLFVRKEESSIPGPVEMLLRSRSQADISINLFNVGFVSSAIQLLLLREIMNISGGYELIAGTFLGSWLIASAVGSAMALKSPLNNIFKINLLFFLGPVVSVFFMMMLTRFFLNPGETPHTLQVLYLLFVIICPIVSFLASPFSSL
jgi:hypothetical protein